MAEPIFKIATRSDWDAARAAGHLAGTPVDLADGYIHFSTPAQLAQTLERHYWGRSDLVLLTVDPDRIGVPLTWEPARDGDLFPHLYAPLPLTAVVAERPLDARPDGGFDLPEIG